MNDVNETAFGGTVERLRGRCGGGRVELCLRHSQPGVARVAARRSAASHLAELEARRERLQRRGVALTM